MRWTSDKEYTQYQNCVFEDTMEILEFGKTRSGSPYMILKSIITEYRYPMRWMQMKDYFLNGVVDRGVLSGIFTFDLKWNYFTLALVDPEYMPIILNEYELRGPYWWHDHQVIELKH